MVRELLINEFGEDAPFLQQAQDGVEVFVHRCIEQLGAPGPVGNALPIQHGSDYRMPARNAQQLRMDKAADERQVKRAPGREAVVNEHVTEEEMDRRGELASPVAPLPKKRELILPAFTEPVSPGQPIKRASKASDWVL